MKNIISWINTIIGRKKGNSCLEEEIQSIIDVGEEKGLIDQQSGDMIQGVLDFRQMVAREVMIPRTEIVAISSNSKIDDILDLILKHGHTRMPVYSENVDNIIGILNVKDLLRFWSKPIGEEDIVSTLRKAYYIPETKNIHLLLHELKDKKSHIAIVIDEYGGTSGLVTLEDLIEEIVGEIYDEHDMEENSFSELPNGDVLVDGRVEIEEFEEYFNMKVPEGQFETLGGFILHIIKKIPLAGDVVNYENLQMIIETADERSIKKIRIKKPDTKNTETEPSNKKGK